MYMGTSSRVCALEVQFCGEQVIDRSGGCPPRQTGYTFARSRFNGAYRQKRSDRLLQMARASFVILPRHSGHPELDCLDIESALP